MAVTNVVGIYNLALNAVGERNNISSPTETSRQAEVCNLWYETVRDHILSAAPWPEATRQDYLAELSEQDDHIWTAGEPRQGYRFSYALPSDCLRPRYLTNFSKFLLTERDNVKRVNTNTENAILVYTAVQENISLWSADFKMSVIYGLAAHICTPLSGKPSRAKMLGDKANEFITTARVNAANSDNETHESIPEWIRARGYVVPDSTRYLYPQASLLAVGNVH